MSFDILIKNGRVVDGTGNPWFWADVGIKDGRIAAMGHLSGEEGKTIIDSSGLVVSPGFIDVHTHSDTVLLINPRGDSHIRQGVTTNIIGNCGGSAVPVSDQTKRRYEEMLKKYDLEEWTTLGEFLEQLEKRGTSLNVGSLVGNATVRRAVMGMEKRAPTVGELEEMKRLVAEAMEDGAFGLSTGLFYAPSGFADTDEVVELAKVAAKYGGIYVSHIRGEGDTLLEALGEAIEIGERADLPVHISHHKAFGKSNWGKVKETLKMMKEARKRGIEITCDAYAWRAGATGLTASLPHWVHEGGAQKLTERLKDPETRQRIRKDMAEGTPGWESVVHEMGWENVMISSCPGHEEYEGRRVAEIAAEKGVDPYDFVFDLLVEVQGRVGMIIFGMHPDDVSTVLKSPFTMMASDSSATTPTPGQTGKPHPRGYGNFVKVLGKYVREEGLLTLEEAVRKMTSMPAQKLGLLDRGLLRVGAWADVVIFDPEKVASKATYLNPRQFPVGVNVVIVNGVITVEEGKHTEARAGKVLRRPPFIK